MMYIWFNLSAIFKHVKWSRHFPDMDCIIPNKGTGCSGALRLLTITNRPISAAAAAAVS